MKDAGLEFYKLTGLHIDYSAKLNDWSILRDLLLNFLSLKLITDSYFDESVLRIWGAYELWLTSLKFTLKLAVELLKSTD